MRVRDPLRHLNIAEVSTGLLAGYCGRLFADLGGEVRRVDASAPTLSAEPPSLLLPYLAHGKRALDLDPNATDFHARLDEVLSQSDILIEDTWPGLLFTGSAAPEALVARHPHLVVITLSPFGRTGPCASWRGGELCAQAFGGICSATGETEKPPLKVAGNVLSYTTAVQGFTAGLSAVQARRVGGGGRVIDFSAAQCVTGLEEFTFMYNSLGLLRERSASPWPFIYPLVPFPCADGFFTVGLAYTPTFDESHAAMAEFLCDPSYGEDSRFRSWDDGFMNLEAMGERIRAGIADRTRDELFADGTSLRVCCGPVLTHEEILSNAQLEARDFWKQIELSSGETVKAPGSPIRMITDPRVSSRNDAGVSAATRKTGPRSSAAGRRPLEGIRVVDFTIAWAGPTVTRVLGELGADVIRLGSLQYLFRNVETPIWPENDPGDEPWNRHGYQLDKYLGKREIAMDILEPRGRELLEELLAVSDVFIENHSPRALKNMNLNYETLAAKFPHLIMLSISGFGQQGPWGERLSTGDVIEGVASLSYSTGYVGGEPERAGYTVFDAISGSVGAAGVLAALEYRAEHGHGVYLDHSMQEAATAIFPEAPLGAAAGSAYPVRNGSRHATRAPHDIYPCSGDDQWIAIDVDSEDAWRALTRVLDRSAWLEDARFATLRARLEHSDALDAALAEATRDGDKTALAERLQAAGVAAAPVQDLRELMFHPHLIEREQVQKVRHPLIGNRTWLRYLPGLIGGFDLSIPCAAPKLGEHNEEVLGGLLGLSAEELEDLERKQIIGKTPLVPVEVKGIDLDRLDEFPGIRGRDPHYRERLGLDDD